MPLPAEAIAERILPEGIPIFDVFNAACDEPFTTVTDSGFKFFFQGCFDDQSDDEHFRLGFHKLRIGFHWPTLLSNYTVDDPTLVDLDDSSHPFAALVRAKNKVGDTPIQNQQSLLTLGEIDARGIIKIRETDEPFLLKVRNGGGTDVELGEPLSYTITYGNPSINELLNVTVTDIATFTPYNPDGSLGDEVEISRQTFNLGTVAANTATTLEFEMVAPTVPGIIRNRVESAGAAGENCQGCEPELVDEVETSAEPELEITKELISAAQAPAATGAPDEILAGTTAVYLVRVKNVGEYQAENVWVTDIAAVGSDATGVDTRHFSHFSLGTLPPGAEFGWQISVPIPTTDAGRQILNRVTVNVPDTDPAEVRHNIIGADVIVSKQLIDPPGGVTAALVRGSVATYEITVQNVGTAAANNVSLLDTVSIEGSIIEGPTTIPVGTLAPGQSHTATLSVVVPTVPTIIQPCPTLCVQVPQRLTNLAQVVVDGAFGVLTTTTNTIFNPTLGVTKTLVEPTGHSIPGGSTVTYLIVVENTDTLVARDVRLTDRARIGNTVIFEQTYELGTLALGERREVTVRFTVPRGFDGLTVVNEATTNYRQTAVTTSHIVTDPAIGITKTLVDPATGVISSTGQPSLVIGGSSVDYAVTVTNHGAVPTAAFTVTDTASVETRAANGAVSVKATLPPQVFNVPVLQPGANFTFTVTIAVPTGVGGATLVNRVVPSVTGVATAGTAHGVFESATLLVTELVLNPQQDWSDSSGGNSVPFDGTPGNGAIDSDDVWVEITMPVTATENWRVVLTDSSGATFSKVFGQPSTGSLVRVLSGFGPMALPITTVDVRDETDAVRQTIDVSGIEAIYLPVTGSSDEALAWSIFGLPSPVIQQFVRRPATIGVFSPF